MSLMAHAPVGSLFPVEVALKFALSLPPFTRDSSLQSHVTPTFRVGNRRLDLDHGRVRTIIESRVMHRVELRVLSSRWLPFESRQSHYRKQQNISND
jgi:hypothetical protein